MSKNVRHKHRDALLIIDMINRFDFPEGKKLLIAAKPAAQKIAQLKKRAKKSGVPVLYVNDNFGQWQSDWKRVFSECSSEQSLGRDLARLLQPLSDDYFVLKPQHSGFFSTSLEVLLNELGAEHVILTGVAADICILLTAFDAHMRGYKVTVTSDCVAANSTILKKNALHQLQKYVQVKGSSKLVFKQRST